MKICIKLHFLHHSEEVVIHVMCLLLSSMLVVASCLAALCVMPCNRLNGAMWRVVQEKKLHNFRLE